ncbi:MAG: DUF1830 domain-containing protein [Cyanobacteria bacterium P01_G01_bin.38]
MMFVLKSTDKILCCYTNQTSQFQIVRISNIPCWFFERTILPKGQIRFEALTEAQLEIHTGTITSAIFSDVISCRKLVQVSKMPT